MTSVCDRLSAASARWWTCGRRAVRQWHSSNWRVRSIHGQNPNALAMAASPSLAVSLCRQRGGEMNVASEYLQHSRESADELVRRHAPLVRRIAYHLMGRLPTSVDVGDLIQAGMIGLLEASRNYAL